MASQGRDPVSIGDIEAAAARLAGHAVLTPLLESPLLNARAGRRVLIKPECLQKTGSFKFRGGWSALTALSDDDRARGVLAYSSGNHAQGVAHAAELLGIPAVIVMPADAPALKIANTRAMGAEVVLYDRQGGEDREAMGRALVAERGLVLVRPFDEPMVIAGQGTTGLEIAAQVRDAGVDDADVLVCCGGGGLSAGVALALEARAPGLRVRTVEPEHWDDVARSLVAGERLAVEEPPPTLCDAIVTLAPGELTFPVLKRLAGPGLAVSDAEVLDAMALAMIRLKVVAEPGGAVALAAALHRRNEIAGDAVIVVISGGNADQGVIARALATL